MIKVKTFVVNNSLKNLNHIVYCEESKNTIISDPYDLEIIESFICENKLNPIAIVNTHFHADHIRHNEVVSNRYKIPIIKNTEDQEIKISKHGYLKSIFTPGHVGNHFAFGIYSSEQCIGYITGDTLFNAGVGNCKNGGDLESLYKTITEVLSNFEPSAYIYPSHDYFLTNLKFAKKVDPENKAVDYYIDLKQQYDQKAQLLLTKIEDEFKYNPFLRLKELSKYDKTISLEKVFYKIRTMRDNW